MHSFYFLKSSYIVDAAENYGNEYKAAKKLNKFKAEVITMNVNMTPISRAGFQIPRNEWLSAARIKEICPEAEFTGLSNNARIDSQGNRWVMNNDPYTKVYGKYDAYAYEWTVGTGDDYRSSYSKNHPTENMGFEDFLGYVRENGLDKQVSAAAIKANVQGFYSADHTTLSQRADYYGAYYAQVENHINTNFSGEERAAQMKILDDTMNKFIKDFANEYADYAGGFLEQYGRNGEREKVRQSVTELVRDKIDGYRNIIAENPDFADIMGTEDEWLTGSHRFMASELQKAAAQRGSLPQKEKNGLYSENDLLYIGKITSSLPQNYDMINRFADEETVGFTLGTVMVKTLELGSAMGVGSSAYTAVKGAVKEYQKEYMNRIDEGLADRRRHAVNSRERKGMDPLDRQAVMTVADKMQIEYENTRNLMNALFKGITEGFNKHMEKSRSGILGDQLRYSENDVGFWNRMYSTLDRTEATSVRIERDALIFKSALEKKNLDVDMGFNALHSGYFSFDVYAAKPTGKIVSEFVGF